MTTNSESHGDTQSTTLNRRDVVAKLLANRDNLLVIAGLGAPAWDITAAGDHPLSFPLWGAMGGAAMVALGVALAQPTRKVLCITGDGEMLMGLGSLATIGVQQPHNLSIVVLDNERYGETGMQKTHTAFGVDLAAIAKAAGFGRSVRVTNASGVTRLASLVHKTTGLLFAQVKISTEKVPLVLPPKDGELLKNRFRSALLK